MPLLVVPSLSSALPAIIAIAIPSVIVVLFAAILVISIHVVVERQYPGCRAIEPQAAYGLAGEAQAEGSSLQPASLSPRLAAAAAAVAALTTAFAAATKTPRCHCRCRRCGKCQWHRHCCRCHHRRFRRPHRCRHHCHCRCSPAPSSTVTFS